MQKQLKLMEALIVYELREVHGNALYMETPEHMEIKNLYMETLKYMGLCAGTRGCTGTWKCSYIYGNAKIHGNTLVCGNN